MMVTRPAAGLAATMFAARDQQGPRLRIKKKKKKKKTKKKKKKNPQKNLTMGPARESRSRSAKQIMKVSSVVLGGPYTR